MSVSNHKSVGNFGQNLVQHFAYVKKFGCWKQCPIWQICQIKIFMKTVPTKREISKIWHKNIV